MRNEKSILLNKANKAMKILAEHAVTDIFSVNLFDDEVVLRFDEAKLLTYEVMEPLVLMFVRDNITWEIGVNDHSHELEITIKI